MAETNTRAGNSGIRIATDYGPILIFFAVNFLSTGLEIQRALNATLAFIIAAAVAMAVSWWKTKRISPMLWATSLLVLVFGGLTLYFHDLTILKMKPTFVYLIFALVLGYGLLSGKPLLQQLMDAAYPGLSERGWRMLTINWAVFFAAMAIANELVWRNFSWDGWVTYKTWGATSATFVFALINIPMLMRNGLKLDKPEEAPIPPEG